MAETISATNASTPIHTRAHSPALPASEGWGTAVVAPDPAELLPVRVEPIDSRALVWAVACHGGSGASTLAAMLEHVGDSGRSWPGREDESPFVILVARDSSDGLAAADRAIRQFRTGLVPPGTQLVGLVLVAASPRKPATAVRQRRSLISALVDTIWPISWHEYLLGTDREQLPQVGPHEEDRKKWSPTVHVPPEVVAIGKQIVTTVKELLELDEQ
ncbi:hypothetical protein FOS14_19460 [Skermania sp. ID1734]|uniref:hypothetical protein n=1 Tax=Skermania sp. ID1734 TaxID=2597516 RepID=UPI00117D6DA9|nr:hypothetical protein [Skermania sp. ID1734]TSD94822.1 hypothetical protein FOS14_19460 [Skermania sp. ID1734]